MDFWEFLGVMIGDGCVMNYPNVRVYGIQITGNCLEEQEYYQEIKIFLERTFDANARVYERFEKKGNSLRLVCYSKQLVEHLEKYNILPRKTYFVQIPKEVIGYKDREVSLLRGIFETDGSLYFSKSRKEKYPTYPRIEFSTVSENLARDIVGCLANQGFEAKFRENRGSLVIYLSGERNLYKWASQIGFSSLKNSSKFAFWQKFGYYIPRMTLDVRLEKLRVCG